MLMLCVLHSNIAWDSTLNWMFAYLYSAQEPLEWPGEYHRLRAGWGNVRADITLSPGGALALQDILLQQATAHIRLPDVTSANESIVFFRWYGIHAVDGLANI